MVELPTGGDAPQISAVEEPQSSAVDHPFEGPHPPPPPPPSDHTSNPQSNGSKPKINKKRNNNDKKRGGEAAGGSSSSNSSSPSILSHHSSHRGVRIGKFNRRNPRVSVRRRASVVETIAFHLGISIAAVIAEVLKRKDLTNEDMSIDHLSTICTAAVRESLSKVFGDKFDAFTRNFEESFASTLSALGVTRNFCKFDDHSPDKLASISFEKEECSSRGCDFMGTSTESIKQIVDTPELLKEAEDLEDDRPAAFRSLELSLHGDMNHQLSHSGSNIRSLKGNNLSLSTIEKSVVEQSRANDLKIMEIGLIRKKLQLKETQLALNSDSNILKRCKLSMGVTRASFKAEKFKSQLEETRHSELLRTCADFLVAGLFLMSVCLGYGVFAFSFEKISQITKACSPSTESKSWWIPRPMAVFNSGLQNLSCQVIIYSRMLFGVLMILAIAYVLIQRSASSPHSMPLTFIVLLLGVACGFAGKFCVGTLGGDGYLWLMYWEGLCALHFFANVFTPTLYFILNGEVHVSENTKFRSVFPYWIRRWLFYFVLILVPICCGLLPFASPRKWWEEHFSGLINNHLLAAYDESYDDGFHE